MLETDKTNRPTPGGRKMSAQQALSLYPEPGVATYTHRPEWVAPVSPRSEIKAARDAKRRLDIMRRRDIERAASCARQIWYRKNALHIEIEGHVVVTIDEVRALLGINPVKGGKENNYLGCTFTARIPGKNMWSPVMEIGKHSSTVKGSHGNGNTYWTMLPEKWPVKNK